MIKYLYYILCVLLPLFKEDLADKFFLGKANFINISLHFFIIFPVRRGVIFII